LDPGAAVSGDARWQASGGDDAGDDLSGGAGGDDGRLLGGRALDDGRDVDRWRGWTWVEGRGRDCGRHSESEELEGTHFWQLYAVDDGRLCLAVCDGRVREVSECG
jgi:hypothetical protein